MPHSLSFSTWNIHGLSYNVLGDKTKFKDFTDNIMKTDFMFLTETWSDKEINIPGFKAFVSDPISHFKLLFRSENINYFTPNQ
jgi:hypothetical protein